MAVIDQPIIDNPQILIIEDLRQLLEGEIDSHRRQRLLDAVAQIEEHGWWGNGPDGPDGEVCVAVALFGDNKPIDPIIIQKLENEMGASIPVWNDTICQSQDEAIAMLLKVANA